MKKNEKRIISILIVITVVTIIIAIMMSNKKEKKVEEGNTLTTKEEFVDVLKDGTRLNTSNHLKQKKTIEGMEITDIQLTEKDNVTLLLGKVTNTASTIQGGYPVNVKIVDKQGNEIITIDAYLGPLEPGQSTRI